MPPKKKKRKMIKKNLHQKKEVENLNQNLTNPNPHQKKEVESPKVVKLYKKIIKKLIIIQKFLIM